MRNIISLIITLLLIGGSCLYSQKIPKRGAMLLVGVTGTGYYGDLNAGDGGPFTATFFSVSPGIEVALQPSQWGRFAPQIRVGYSRFQAQDPDARTNPPDPIETPDGAIVPNTFADVTLPYLSIGLEGRLFSTQKSFSPIVSAGLRVLSFSSKNDEGVPLAQLWTTRLPEERTLPSLTPALDLAFGFETRLNDRLRLVIAYHHVRSGSDYLDNLGKLGRQEGNDKLHSLRISMGFDLGK